MLTLLFCHVFFLAHILVCSAHVPIRHNCPNGQFQLTMMKPLGSVPGGLTTRYQAVMRPSNGGRKIAEVTSCTALRFGAGCKWSHAQTSQLGPIFVKHPVFTAGFNYTGQTVSLNSCDCDGDELPCKSDTSSFPIVDPDTGQATIYLITNVHCQRGAGGIAPPDKATLQKIASAGKLPQTKQFPSGLVITRGYNVPGTTMQLLYLLGWCGKQTLNGRQWSSVLGAWFNDFKKHPTDNKDVIGHGSIAVGAQASIDMRYLRGVSGRNFTLDIINRVGNAMEEFRRSKGSPSRSQYILQDKRNNVQLAQLSYSIDVIGA